jgi:hypothetical protein
MRKTVGSMIAFLALALSATAARADVKTDPAAKIQYEVPAGFVESKNGNMVEYDDPKKEMAFILVVTDAKTEEKAQQELEAVVNGMVKDMKVVKDWNHGNTNKLINSQIKTTATYEGKPVNLTLRVYHQLPEKSKKLIVVGMYLSDKKAALAPTFSKFFESIKPL